MHYGTAVRVRHSPQCCKSSAFGLSCFGRQRDRIALFARTPIAINCVIAPADRAAGQTFVVVAIRTVSSCQQINRTFVQFRLLHQTCSQEIKKVNNCRYVGVIVDDELKWTERIDYIHSKLLKCTSINCVLKFSIQFCLMSIMHFFILTFYAVEVYGNT